ncbi:MAG TPA: chemotaxis protein CheB, partial [Acidimicrobiales bacterium]
MADADAGDHPGPSPTGELDVDLVVVGGSAGGIDALQRLLQALPDDLGAAVVVALHRPANRTSALVPVLRRCTGLPLEGAADGAQLRRGEVVVAPPDEHVVVVGAGIHLSRGARINGHRPSIDPLFESAARAFGPRVLGVLLSGALDDGVAGLAAIRAAGGTTAVQAPAEAAFPGMPTAAIDAGVVDHVLPVAGLAGLVVAGARGEG